MVKYAALTPLVELTIADEEVAPGLYRVRAVVKNLGFLPTNITAQALKAKVAKKATIEIDLEDAVELVMGREKLELDHLEGRSHRVPGRFYTPLGPKRDPPGRFFGGMFITGSGDRSLQAAEWLVKAEEGAQITVIVSSEKGGVDKKTITLGG